MNFKDVDSQIKATIEHYNNRAQPFWERTKDHDVRQNYEALLSHCVQNQKLSILDLGCGPGRDLKYFSELGHHAVGVDASAEFCKMAREYSSCEVWQQNFLELDLPDEYFHGIFANASLFHVPQKSYAKVLSELHSSLKKDGILFQSNPRGSIETFDGSRYGNYMEFIDFEKHLAGAGFRVLKHYYRPKGKPRIEQPWLAIVALKI